MLYFKTRHPLSQNSLTKSANLPMSVSYTHLDVYKRQALRTVEVAIQMRQLHALALHDGVVGQVALDATAQAAASRAFEIATNMREMHAIANPDVMFRYDYAYEAMQGQRVVQESVQDFPCHVVSSDYQSHLQVVELSLIHILQTVHFFLV